MPIRIFWRPGRRHWLLARRNMSTGELAYYVRYGPQKTWLLDLARIAGTRWAIEGCFQQAKNQASLDEYQPLRPINHCLSSVAHSGRR